MLNPNPNGRSRFIPACAGNAGACFVLKREQAVHPRMRGERLTTRATEFAYDGSSPHARGTRLRIADGKTDCRFIPACAGNAILILPQSVTLTVHPRMRGERPEFQRRERSQCGSSPHARGTPTRRRNRHICRRFIPACAGNAPPTGRPWQQPAVHPRMRGERCDGISAKR